MNANGNKVWKPITILMAEDDSGDRLLTQEGFEESRLASDLRFVEDGEQLMDYLYRRGQFADPAESPYPGLILLDVSVGFVGKCGNGSDRRGIIEILVIFYNTVLCCGKLVYQLFSTVI